MERLTKRELNSHGYVEYIKCHGDVCSFDCGVCGVSREGEKKLKHYEDLEEQGLLLKLPCKVGDEVYYISPHNTISLDKGVIYKGDVTRVYAMEEETCITIKIHTEYGVTELSNITDFGKTVFLTKAEAEKALGNGEVGMAV